MKSLYKIIAFFALLLVNSNIDAQTITVKEDVFIQGGNTADKALGVDQPKNLLVFNSKANTKYARITYLKFKVAKDQDKVDEVKLNLYFKVFQSKKNQPEDKFSLQVYGVDNDDWSDQTITWNNAPKLGALLASTEVEQSLDNKEKLLTITLDTKEFNKLFKGKKDRIITLALTNDNFNKLSAKVKSKEQYSKHAATLELK